jgi:iron complex outermembrane receptor protein
MAVHLTRETTRGARLLGGAFLLALVAIGPGAAGEEETRPPDLANLSLEELMDIDVVYGASRFEQKITQAPASVTVVSGEEIRRYGYGTLAEILGSVRGLYTTYDRNYSFVGVRGFQRPGDYNMRTLIMVDGHRINDSVYESVLIGTDALLHVEDIERIEVIRGPSSSIYGTGAFFAVINVITRSGASLGGAEFSAGVGSYETVGGRLAWGRKTEGGVDWFVTGSALDSDGQDHYFPEFDDPLTNNGLAQGVDGDDFKKVFGKLSFGNFRFEGAYASREKVIPTAPYGSNFNDPDNRTTDDRSFLSLSYNRPVGRNSAVTARAYADRYYYRGDYDYAAPYNLWSEHAWACRRGLEVQVNTRVGDRHTLVAGGEFRDHFRADFYAADATGVYSDFRNSPQDWGLFVQDEFTVTKKLTINFGLRHDQYDVFGGSTNPRLAVILSPTQRTYLKFLYGQAFRAPSIYELYYSGTANPLLQPEEMRSAEAVLEHYLGRSSRVTAALFLNRIDSLISLDALGSGLFENIGDVQSEGIEMELERDGARGFGMKAGFALQKTKDQDNGLELSNSPEILARAQVFAPVFTQKVKVGAEIAYTGERLTLAGEELGGFVLWNLTLTGRNVVPGLDLSAGVYNLLDKEYASPGSAGHLQDTIPQDGRRFGLRATWRF